MKSTNHKQRHTMSRTYKDSKSGKKQWRSHHNNYRDRGGYNRAHMKHIHNTEEGATIIKQDGMSWGHNADNNTPSYKLIQRFLLQHVGQPWDDVEKAIHEHTELLRGRGVTVNLNHWVATHENAWRWCRFYVDNDGILRHNKPRTRSHDIRIPVNPTRYYRLADVIRRAGYYSGPAYKKRLALFEVLSAQDYTTLMKGTAITEKAYEKMKERYTNRYAAIVERYSREYIGPYGSDGYWDRYTAWGSSSFADIFEVEEVYDEMYVIKYRSKEYKQYHAEQTKAARRGRAYINRERAEREMGLLRTLEADRKAEEAQENHISVIRHGFDEQESFRGLEYHGQKRKREVLVG